MGTLFSNDSSQDQNKVLIHFGDRTGHWMNHWTVAIGEYSNQPYSDIIETSIDARM